MHKYKFCAIVGLVLILATGCQTSSASSTSTIQRLESDAVVLEEEVADFETENAKLNATLDELTSVGTAIETTDLDAYAENEAEIARIILESGNNLNHLIIEDINIDQITTDDITGYHVEATAGYRPSSSSGLYDELSTLSSYLADTLEGQPCATVHTLKLNYHDDTHGQTIWYYYERVGEDLILTDSHA